MQINTLLVNVEGNSYGDGETNAEPDTSRPFRLDIPDDTGIGELYPVDVLDVDNDLV